MLVKVIHSFILFILNCIIVLKYIFRIVLIDDIKQWLSCCSLSLGNKVFFQQNKVVNKRYSIVRVEKKEENVPLVVLA